MRVAILALNLAHKVLDYEKRGEPPDSPSIKGKDSGNLLCGW